MSSTSAPSTRVIVHPDADTVAAATAARLLTNLIDTQSVQPIVHVVLTGGTVGIKTLAQVAASSAAGAVDWSGVHFWWGDERFLPAGDPDRNETQAREAFLDAFEDVIPAENIHYVPRLDPGAGVDTPEKAASLYAQELARFAPEGEAVPKFDVLLLGMGPDGHIASLFPGHPMLAAKGSTTGVHDSPKPPPLRVSLTFDAIAQAKAIWLAVAGADKADALALAWSNEPAEIVPAGSVNGTEETLWLVDVAAASKAEPSQPKSL